MCEISDFFQFFGGILSDLFCIATLQFCNYKSKVGKKKKRSWDVVKFCESTVLQNKCLQKWNRGTELNLRRSCENNQKLLLKAQPASFEGEMELPDCEEDSFARTTCWNEEVAPKTKWNGMVPSFQYSPINPFHLDDEM